MSEYSLDDDQLDLLYEAQRLEDPRVIEGETIERTKQLLGTALEAYTGVKDGSDLPLDKQVNQLIADIPDEDEDIDLSALQQHPQTGGVDAEDVDEANDALEAADTRDDPVEALERQLRSADKETRVKAARAVAINSRLPEHSQDLLEEVGSRLALGSTPDVDALREAGYSDPKKV